MAAILDENGTLNLDELNEGLAKRLPKYARPIFIRLLREIQLTETYKMKKKQLKEEGYNPHLTADRLYYYCAKQDKYLQLTKNVYQAIISGELVF